MGIFIRTFERGPQPGNELLQRLHSSFRKQQCVYAIIPIRVGKILGTTDVSQRTHASGTNNPVNIGTTEINIKYSRKRAAHWPGLVKIARKRKHTHLILISALDEGSIPASGSITQAEQQND